MVPKSDKLFDPENKAEIKEIKTVAKSDNIIQDFGKIIFPSINLAIVQKIIVITKPITNKNPFADSTGILVNGKKKIGNKVITQNKDQKEILSNIFDNINFKKVNK